MTSLWGWAGLASPPATAAAALEERTDANAAARPDACRFFGSLCGLAAVGNGIEGFQEGTTSVVVIGRPRWQGAPARDSVARRIVAGYRASGIGVLQSLTGAFALALTEDGGRTALLAVDRMGIASLT